ncbi:MAG: ATP-binding protein [Erysipelotrichaceae bacterium]|nr:ATP-binding protein [Erysipelotrichaceae bacterium]
MLKRKAEERIRDWIEGSKKALLVSGARQVGKTYSIRKCLTEVGCNYLEINLIEQPELIPVFERSMSVDDLRVNLSAATGYSFAKGESILFIDEIQEVKDIVTRIKFWVDEGSFRYILSGSLLGIELKGLRSAPVGYLEEIKMYPLDFEEFLIASSVNEDVLEHLRRCFEESKPVGELIHDKIMKHFHRYLVVGGMPDAVREYVESGDISKVTIIQQNIRELYKLDFTKYEAEDKKLMIISVYETMPSQLLKQNRRFNYADIKKGLRFEKLESSFLWLTSAGVVIPTYNATEPRASLSQNQKSSLLKLYSSDVGLLTASYGNALRTKILVADDKVNLGGIYENAVAQELNTHGFQSWFYNSHKNGELDFVIEEDNEVVPIEVKSGKDYYVHSAIPKAINNPEYEINKAYVFTNYDVETDGKIVYLPVYMAMFINDDTILPVLDPII